MAKRTKHVFPAVALRLARLGDRLRLARKRRRISASQFAERIGVSRDTAHRIEKGDPTIAIGTYASALRILGLDEDLEGVARDDELGRKLQDAALEAGTRGS
jgi:transcriptional regulator with XRE-family HTH domain